MSLLEWEIRAVMQQSGEVLCFSAVCKEQFVDVSAPQRIYGRIVQHIVGITVAHRMKDILQECFAEMLV